jgi:phosphosulfolactate synthase (CoM biosynthesis protein A)
VIIYRTKNNINGKTYIGMDAANNPNYFGSGVAVKNAIKKYGKKNFTKEVVESGFLSYEELAQAEIKWIALEKASNVNGIYNLNDGGLGCSSNKGKKSEEIYGEEKASEWKSKISDTLVRKGIKPPSRKGSKGSEKQRLAVSKSSSERVKSELEIQSLIERTVRPIICLETSIEYPSLKSAAKSLNLSKGNICSVLKGDRKHTKGLTFKYLGQ